MKSKISFFNSSLLRKDVRRFAPVWALFLIFLLMMPMPDGGYDSAWELTDSIGGFGVIHMIYAMVCAQMLFGDLFSSRMCYALHALPIRRESWFLTHVLAGFLFCAGPVMAAAMIWTVFLGEYWLVALLWAAALLLQFFFFFAVAVLSMLLSGNRFGALAIYSILNFLAGIALWLVYALYVPHLYGVELNYEPWLRLCPVVGMATGQWIRLSMADPSVMALLDGWGYVLWCVLAALPCYGLALWLYRKRKLESAGDIMAFRPLAPVFLVLFTFSAGAAFHLFSELFMGEASLLFLLVGLCVGFYACLMLLQRTLRVFRLRTLAQLGVILGVFGLTLLVTALDPMGITKWVPKATEVESVTVSPYYAELNGMGTSQAIQDPQTVEKVVQLHKYAVENRSGRANVEFYLTYRMKDGSVVIRHYWLPVDSPVNPTLKQILSRPECVFGSRYAAKETLLKEVDEILLYTDGKEEITIEDPLAICQIVDALYLDSAEGNLCQHWALQSEYDEQSFNIHLQSSRTGWYLTIDPGCRHTYAWLEAYTP